MFKHLSSRTSPPKLPGDALPVAIVGAGFSGTVATSLLAQSGVRTLLIDGSGKHGKGTAYSTEDTTHLLNVPAGRMSAFVDDPDHFLRALTDPGADFGTFAPRTTYGEYLGQILDDALESGNANLLRANVTAARQEGTGWSITLDNGEIVEASALVLAMGNQAPGSLRHFTDAGPQYVDNPWSPEAKTRIADVAVRGGDVLLIGTGLTAVDTMLSLEAAGFTGNITAMSRRGLMPQSHGTFDPAPIELGDLPAGSLTRLWRWVRARASQVGWRAAIDSLRPHSQALWQSFPIADRKRFMRHARAWWDVRRHRIAPDVASTIDRLKDEGRLEVIAAKVEAARQCCRSIDVAFRRRGENEAEWRKYALVINCTGPLHAMSRTSNPLLRSLLDQGLASPDALDIGLEVDQGARVVGSERLWALGALTKASYWEIVAVPDIREQVAAVAGEIVEVVNVEIQHRERA